MNLAHFIVGMISNHDRLTSITTKAYKIERMINQSTQRDIVVHKVIGYYDDLSPGRATGEYIYCGKSYEGVCSLPAFLW